MAGLRPPPGFKGPDLVVDQLGEIESHLTLNPEILTAPR